MKILNAKVYDYPALGWMNKPHLQILVDKMFKWEDYEHFVYRTVKTNVQDEASEEQKVVIGSNWAPKLKEPILTAYLTEQEGYVRFFLHNPKNETGFADSIFKGILEDGTPFSVRGPWSSNPAAMEKLFGIKIIDVSLTDEPEVFKRGYTYFGGNITVELAKQAIPFILPDFTITDDPPYLTRLRPMIPQYPEGSPNWHRREYERKKEAEKAMKGGGD